MSQFSDALEEAEIKIIKYDSSKSRPIVTNSLGILSVEKFNEAFKKELGKEAIKYPDVFAALHDDEAMQNLVEAHAKEIKVYKGKPGQSSVPEEFKGLTLNMDLSSGRDTKFFLTAENEVVSPMSGYSYIKMLGMKEIDAIHMARKVIPEYLPRKKPGVSSKKLQDGNEFEIFNTYVPPAWKNYEGMDALPDQLPLLFKKLVYHLFPMQIEREYFFSWLYYSMFKRAYVYLVLCGSPGTGKNRLKIVLRALHGHANTVDGKRSTLVERFNSQLADATLGWFDELHYDQDMENNMKELQNDSISIERKGIDATRSTNIHASLIISNNKPRDNYIALDARKFAPLVIRQDRLEKSMTALEIDTLSRKVENRDAPTFDIKFLAQIAKWVKKNGKSNKWPNLEYRGPMFYKLAHTSMSRAQKKSVALILELNPSMSNKITFDSKKGFLWSTVEEYSMRKNGDKSLKFPPDYSTTKHFFDVFLDGKGRKAFKTEDVEGSIMGDFWVKKIIEDAKIITESDKVEAKEVKSSVPESEFIDL